jgi:hypothetical protein
MFTKQMRIALGVLMLAVVGCASPLPTDSALPAARTAAAPSGVSQNRTLAVPVPKLPTLPVPIVNQLLCALPDTLSIDIGPSGGTISVGGSSLVVPAHSLDKPTHIRMKMARGKKGAVKFFPEGLKFNRGASPTLTLNTDCVGNPAGAYIVYTDDYGNVLERLTTTSRTPHSVSAQIHHFSRYAVGW